MHDGYIRHSGNKAPHPGCFAVNRAVAAPHHKQPAWCKDIGGLPKRAKGIIQMVQHIPERDDIPRPGRIVHTSERALNDRNAEAVTVLNGSGIEFDPSDCGAGVAGM